MVRGSMLAALFQAILNGLDRHRVAVGALLNTRFEMGLGQHVFILVKPKRLRPRLLFAFGVPEIVACIPLSLEIRGARH